MCKIRFDRLKKLAEHLRKGKLAHKKFNFQYVHINGSKLTEKEKKIGLCGTNGCAIGEMPMIFKDWKYGYIQDEEKKEGVLKGCLMYRGINVGDKGFEDSETVIHFFGLDDKNYEEEFNHLFCPNDQNEGWLHPSRNGKVLTSRATKKSVAQNIEWFIKNKGFRNQKSE